MFTQLILDRKHAQQIIDYVNDHAPLEACGLMAGKRGRVEKIFFVRNQAQSPERFVMDPYEQLHAFDWIDDNDSELLGIFHSHPAGPETVSPTDIAEAAYEVVHVICSKKNDTWSMHGFWIENGVATEVALQFVD
jgi:proteasome lid subunit RPN8/RPN11